MKESSEIDVNDVIDFIQNNEWEFKDDTKTWITGDQDGNNWSVVHSITEPAKGYSLELTEDPAQVLGVYTHIADKSDIDQESLREAMMPIFRKVGRF